MFIRMLHGGWVVRLFLRSFKFNFAYAKCKYLLPLPCGLLLGGVRLRETTLT